MKTFQFFVRFVFTVFLLIAVYRGSRGALVFLLTGQAVYNELIVALLRRKGIFK